MDAFCIIYVEHYREDGLPAWRVHASDCGADVDALSARRCICDVASTAIASAAPTTLLQCLLDTLEQDVEAGSDDAVDACTRAPGCLDPAAPPSAQAAQALW